VAINIRKVYWEDISAVKAQNSILGVLQVAAKAHEILIIFSLSELVFHISDVAVPSQDGIHFGLFTSAYLLASGGYLVQKDFWNSVMMRRNNKAGYFTWRRFLACVYAFDIDPIGSHGWAGFRYRDHTTPWVVVSSRHGRLLLSGSIAAASRASSPRGASKTCLFLLSCP
jgi:hypothetical protein